MHMTACHITELHTSRKPAMGATRLAWAVSYFSFDSAILSCRRCASRRGLKGRRLTMREPELVASSTGAAQQVIEGVPLAAEEAGHDRGLDDALDEHVREQGTCPIVAYGRELSGLYWLDSIVVLLSLGHMGILMHGAALTSACLNMAFLLAPRRVGDGLAGAERSAGPSRGQAPSRHDERAPLLLRALARHLGERQRVRGQAGARTASLQRPPTVARLRLPAVVVCFRARGRAGRRGARRRR